MRYIINDNQRRILETLSQYGETSRTDLRMLAKISSKRFVSDVPDLIDDGLINVRIPEKRSSFRLHSITEFGKKTLQYHTQHKENPVSCAMPNRRNLFELPVYVPPQNVYARNNGHVNIGSRGACG